LKVLANNGDSIRVELPEVLLCEITSYIQRA